MKNSKTPSKSIIFLTLILLSTVLLSSCLKDLSDDAPQNTSALNVVNASPGPLAINFFLNNNLVNGPALAFGQESTYLLTSSGTKKFDATSGGTFDSILADTVTLETDKYYSIFITGENDALSTLLTEDDLSAPASGKVKIRFINLSPDGGNLTLSTQDGPALFTDQGFKTASAFAQVDPAAYALQLKNSAGFVEHEANVDLVAGRIYTVWAGGLKDGTDNLDLRLLIRSNN